jgi:hypothetical protein
MMFSGHTYVCGIFALGLYDIIRNLTAQCQWPCRLATRFLAGAALTFLVCFDVTLILLNRFHYTMDCTIAVVLVLLIFSNPAIALAIEWYVGSRERSDMVAREINEESDQGAVLIPPCCIPLCFFQGRYHLHTKPDMWDRYQGELQDAAADYEGQLTVKMQNLRQSEQNLRQSEDECKKVKAATKNLEAELHQFKVQEAKLMQELAALKRDCIGAKRELEKEALEVKALTKEKQELTASLDDSRSALNAASSAQDESRGRSLLGERAERRCLSTDSGWPSSSSPSKVSPTKEELVASLPGKSSLRDSSSSPTKVLPDNTTLEGAPEAATNADSAPSGE